MKNQSGAMTGYVYDAGGIRVAKAALMSFSCNFASNGFPSTTSWTGTSWVLGPGSEQVTEYSVSAGTSTWQHTNVFASGALLASYNGTDTYFALNDWLGTKRAELNATNTCETGFRSLQFGDGFASFALSSSLPACLDATEQHFTGKERDTESGNDYFGARYYASTMGRFMSPDPLPWIHWQNGNRDAQQRFAAYIANPQNFNMYAYVNNNPLNKTDPTGMNACGTNNDSTCHVTITIKDRTRDAKGNYNDQFAGLKGQAGYNATATVTVTGTGADGKAFSASGTFLAKTTPDNSGKSGTIQVGIYDATSTMHKGQYSAILLGTVPTIGPNPRQGGQDFATDIEIHKSGTGGAAVAISDPSHPISMGCQTIYRDQYSDFQSITGLEPSAGSRQGQFTVDVNTQANQLNIAQ